MSRSTMRGGFNLFSAPPHITPMITVLHDTIEPDQATEYTGSRSSLESSNQTTIPITESAEGVLVVEDEEWKSWYGLLGNWDFETRSMKAPATVRARRKDSVVGVEKAANAENCQSGDPEYPPKTNRFPAHASKTPLQILFQLRRDVGLSLPSCKHTLPKSTNNARQPATLNAEVQALHDILSSSLRRKSKIPRALQSTLAARVELTLVVIGRRRYWDRSHFMLNLERQAGELVHLLVDLIDPLKSCIVCSSEGRSSSYKSMITTRCAHETNTCDHCLERWVAQQLSDKGLDKGIKCTECPEVLSYFDLQKCATAATFERYDALATRSALDKIEHFCWCLNVVCNSGQIHLGGARFECDACSYRFCISHTVAWHEGETCEQYENRCQMQKLDDEACEAWKAEQARMCTECNVVIQKNGGCDHMTCAHCSASFSWEDAAGYKTQEFEPPVLEMNNATMNANKKSGSSRIRVILAVVRRLFYCGSRQEPAVEEFC
ncbi:hypothetical protein EJ08DRAFT_162597 [Tothia fuscella]|uniref:RBR-type E3 ubiquitin transferase n=1 Tax=Tothia fuscella TaxID=1048955 RepID=A0A9P4NVQ2_9PEZI|nr:hypothetical protein EJ08DRAFT_162597 [Tothia fuscella]